MIHTAYGPGEVVAQETVRGRTQYQVAGNGFKVWLDEVEVNKRTASDHEGGASFDFEPTDHVNEDNSTTLPYTWQPQYPVDMFRHEQTMSPDHEIDIKKRMKPSDSRSGESREEIHPYPGPNPDLFAAKEGRLAWTFGDEEPGNEEEKWHQYNTHAVGPKELEEPHHGRELEMVGYRPAGLSDKFIEIHEAADHFNDPIVRFRDDPVREIHRHGSIDVSAGLDQETGEWMNLVEADKQIRTAAWSDVRQKAMRLKREGRVAVQDMDHSRVYASVKGDHGEYDVMILKGGAYGGAGGGQSITDWRCSCDWGKWAFKRQLTYVGRLCSHGYATYLTQQAAYLKDNPQHFKPRKKKGSRRLSGVDAFKSWVDKENGGHIDLDAADNYLSTLEEPCSKEDAEKILDYVQTNHSERPERNYDVKGGYTYDEDKVYKNADALRHQPGKLTPHTYVVPEGEESHFEDFGDDRKTTGPDQIMAAKGESTAHHPDFAWHVSDEPDFPEQGIVHFSNRRLALTFTADEGLLNKLRDLSQDAYKPGDMRDRNIEISETVKELRDRGYDADQLVASVRRLAAPGDSDQPKDLGDMMGVQPTSTPMGTNPVGGGGFDPTQLPGVAGGSNTDATHAAPLPAMSGTESVDQGTPGATAVGIKPTDPTGGTLSAPYGGPGGGAPAAPGTPASGVGQGPPPGSEAAHRGENPGAPGAGAISGQEYTVKPGDTLSDIGKQTGTDYNNITNEGGGAIQNKNLITPGEQLAIPGGGGGGGAHGAPTPAAGGGGGESKGFGWGGPSGGGAGSATPSVPAAPMAGNAAGLHGIAAARFAERYFQADESDDEKKLNSPANTNPALNDPSATTVTPTSVNMPDTGPGNHPQPNQGPAYPQISGPGAPAGTPGAQPVNQPRAIDPLHTPENNAPTEGAPSPSSENASATPGAKAVGPNPGQQKENEAAMPGAGGSGGGGMGGFQDAMNIAGPLIGEIGSGIGGLLGGGLGGLTHLFGSNDPQKFATQYFQGAGDFLTKGGPDWMDFPFAGSGPDRQDWSTTSEDYVEEHERPKRQETWRTDNDGDIVKYTDRLKQPKQSRRHADMLSGDAGYGGGPGPEVGGGIVTAPSGGGAVESPASAGSAPTMGQLSNTAAISESAMRFWADAVDKHDQGYYNPHNRPYQEYDKGEHGVGDEGDDQQQGGQQQHGAPGGKGLLDAIGGGGGEAAGGGLAELAPLLAEASRDDGSDIVRQFQASGGGCLDGTSASSGAYSDDAIAAQAQRLLRTAGRNYSLAEQRELEDEFHPRGARNLPTDEDLRGTHYVDI